MNSETFEEVAVDSKVVDEVSMWLEEGSEVNLVFFKGNVIEVVVPTTGVYKIVETEPNMKGSKLSAVPIDGR
jgi:elongation factor P